MFCILAFIVFAILGIFNLSYRALAKEAWGCVWRRLTFRPCQTGFDQKIRSKLVAYFLEHRPYFLAKIFHRYFEALSWLMIIIFIASGVWSGHAIYNLARYQTCSPENPSACVFTPGKVCSTAPHCQPCRCGENEEKCRYPDYKPCGGAKQCDCSQECEGQR